MTHQTEQVMTQTKWTDKNQNGEYVVWLMRHETEMPYGKSEWEALAVLMKIFGLTPPLWSIDKHPIND